MNESYDTTRYALDDDALDGLLSGDIDPSLTGMDSNPVASFFAEVRSTSFADSPKPDPRLDQVFAGAPGAPTAATPAVGPVDRRAEFEPTMINIDSSVNPTGSLDFDDTPAPTRARQNPGFRPASVGVYRPSPLEAVTNALRPTPSKLLVGVSVLLVLVISAQILWFSGSPDEDIQEIAGVETSATAPADGVSSTAPAVVASVVPSSDTVPTTATTVPLAPGQTQAPAPTAATTTPTAPQIGPTTPSVATSPTTTPTVPTSATAPTVPTTGDPATSVVATPTSSTPTSMDTVPVTEPPTSETTAPAAVVTLTPGVVSSVPVNVPAGQYRARVESPAGCTVQVVNAQGNQSSYQAAVGTDIVFQLLDGSRVLIAAGCPTTYRLS